MQNRNINPQDYSDNKSPHNSNAEALPQAQEDRVTTSSVGQENRQDSRIIEPNINRQLLDEIATRAAMINYGNLNIDQRLIEQRAARTSQLEQGLFGNRFAFLLTRTRMQLMNNEPSSDSDNEWSDHSNNHRSPPPSNAAVFP